MDAVIWISGLAVSLYTLAEGLNLFARASLRRRRTTAFHAADGPAFTIDLEPDPGRGANYYG